MNLAVFKHFFIDRREHAIVNNLVLPLIGFALTVWLWFSLSGLTLVIGLSWLAAGFIYLAARTNGLRKPTPVLDLKESV